VQVLRINHPSTPIHGDLHTLNLTEHVAAGKRLHVVVINTPCVGVSARGRGLAQQGQVCPKPRKNMFQIKSDPFKVHEQTCVQEPNLIFTAIDNYRYAKVAGRLPVIVSENVADRRYRRWDERQVSTTIAAVIAAARICTSLLGATCRAARLTCKVFQTQYSL
jgi:hypothetical protein